MFFYILFNSSIPINNNNNNNNDNNDNDNDNNNNNNNMVGAATVKERPPLGHDYVCSCHL